MIVNEKINVLLVEDDPGSQRLVEKALIDNDEKVEYKLQTAGDLYTAKKLLNRMEFDNIVLDLQLPDSNGVETVQQIRMAAGEIPIVVLSATNDEMIGKEALRAGADYYFVKGSFLREMLSRSIRLSIEHKRRQSTENGLIGEHLDEKIKRFDEKFEKVKQSLSEECQHREQIEDTLKKLRYDHTTIFDSAPVAIWYRDKEGSILRANKLAAESVGMNVKDLVGRNYYEIFPDGTDSAKEKDMKVINSGQPISGQMRQYESFDGQVKWVVVDRIPYKNENGDIAGVIVFAHDVTEQKIAEDKLSLARQKIEETNLQLQASVERAKMFAEEATNANHAKSDFLSNMSHEIRSPMNAIIGFADLLMAEELGGDQGQYVEMIQGAGVNLMILINDILDFSKIEAGRIDVEFIPANVGEIVNDVAALMASQATEKGLDFQINCADDIPDEILIDSTRLRQCLINLVGNAIKFTESGHVCVRVVMRDDGNRRQIQFDVEDTGIGIPDEEREAIFNPFAQADGSTTRKFGGTGLGLSITRKLTELLGGKIHLTSQLGKGTIFSMILPVHLPSKNEDYNKDGSRQYRQKENQSNDTPCYCGSVMLVEDNQSSQLLMKILLEKVGLDVTIIADGAQALTRASRDDFDLIITGVLLPSLSGYELAEAVRAKGLTTPIIAATAQASKQIQQDCIEAGCDEFLPKPFTRKDLYALIGKHLSAAVGTC